MSLDSVSCSIIGSGIRIGGSVKMTSSKSSVSPKKISGEISMGTLLRTVENAMYSDGPIVLVRGTLVESPGKNVILPNGTTVYNAVLQE